MTILLLAYGTLLYRESMATTVGDRVTAEKSYRAVTVHGFRRLCNVRPTHYQPSLRLSRDPIEAGALNIEPASECSFNALAFSVTAEELTLLDARERYYRRQRVGVRDFATGDAAGEAFVYACPADGQWIERDPARLLPRWEDVIWPRRGAYRVSAAFGEAYDSSTFLADGQTLLVDRYRDVLEPLPETRS